MNPNYPIYIVSKGRADTRMTAKALEHIGVPYHIVIEETEYDQYAAVIDAKNILVLDKQYQRDYDTFDDLGLTKVSARELREILRGITRLPTGTPGTG